MENKKMTLKLNNRKESKYGIVSFILGVMALTLFGLAIYASAFRNLEVYEIKIYIGVLGLTSMILTIIGIAFGYIAEKAEDVLKNYAHIGLVINGIMTILHIIVIVKGY